MAQLEREGDSETGCNTDEPEDIMLSEISCHRRTRIAQSGGRISTDSCHPSLVPRWYMELKTESEVLEKKGWGMGMLSG